MKKILLSLMLISSFAIVKAQTVLNEIYTEPGAGKSEFFELYNSGAGSQSVDCFTILIYYKNSTTDRGWWVLDLPTLSVGSKGYFTGAAADPFNVQSQSGVDAAFNWNDISFRDGSTGGYLRKYQLNGTNTGYNNVSPANNVAVTDLFTDVSVGGGHNYITLVYVNGIFSNAFWGGGASNTLPAEITSMADITVDMSGACTDFTTDFDDVLTEFKNNSPGSDNGYARKFDGKCGAWDKTSASLNHTPNNSNGGASAAGGDLVISATITCPDEILEPTQITYNITGATGAATEGNSFPVIVDLYIDNGSIPGELDGDDQFIDTKTDDLISDPAKVFQYLPQDVDPILVFTTAQGCFDKVLVVSSSCASLPIKLQSFTAVRDRSNVYLKWTTSIEENNRGFLVQRLIGNGMWQNIKFVPSQAVNGNSGIPLNYELTDINTTRGITQYRLKQVDFDGTTAYSFIRSVRGDGQKGKTIVYPNPSSDGKVNVIFEDVNAIRDVTVTDMSGRMIRQMKAVTNNNIQIDNLTAGFYTVRIVNTETGEQEVQKFVVNKR